MDYMERLEKIRKQAARIKKEDIKPGMLIQMLYQTDSALSKTLQEKERAAYELTRDVYLETLNLHGPENPRTSKVYRSLEQVHGTVHKPENPRERKEKPKRRH